MDSITIPDSHVRAIHTARRKTGAQSLTLGHEDGVTTFSCKGKGGVVASGKITGSTTADVTYATKPKRRQPKATQAVAAPASE